MLYYNTISPLLESILIKLMQEELFNPFRLVGGTSLSLRLGHRLSIDIDLFTNAQYGSLDFSKIEAYLKKEFKYCTSPDKTDIIGFGKSFYIGNSQNQSVKLDLYYYDELDDTIEEVDDIRMATIENIVAMKMEVIAGGGRKKDFWDIHELMESYSTEQLLSIHENYFHYSHSRKELLEGLINFEKADEDFNPICLKGKIWELIKLDIYEAVKNVNN